MEIEPSVNTFQITCRGAVLENPLSEAVDVLVTYQNGEKPRVSCPYLAPLNQGRSFGPLYACLVGYTDTDSLLKEIATRRGVDTAGKTPAKIVQTLTPGIPRCIYKYPR